MQVVNNFKLKHSATSLSKVSLCEEKLSKEGNFKRVALYKAT